MWPAEGFDVGLGVEARCTGRRAWVVEDGDYAERVEGDVAALLLQGGGLEGGVEGDFGGGAGEEGEDDGDGGET